MAPTQQVHLEGDFDAPIVRAQLEIFLLLADAVRPSLADLYRILPVSWHEVITILAKTLQDQLPAMTAVADVTRIWAQFMATARISKLGNKPTAVLETVGARLNSIRRTRDRGLKYLGEANDQALAWIRDLGAERSIPSFEGAQQAPVRVYYDPDAHEYCASSSPLVAEIGWKLQLKEHAFYGALIPDMLFEHEYISHMLPRNRSLSRAVREVWLAVALFRAHKNSRVEGDLKAVIQFLWDKFRIELANHFRGGERIVYGAVHLDAMALNVSFHAPEVFWRMTSEILEIDDTEERAGFVDDLLERMASLDDSMLKQALSSQREDLDEFSDFMNELN